MNDFLDTMAKSSARRAAAVGSVSGLDKPVVPLALGKFDIIAEIKARSPAAGDLVTGAESRVKRARLYARGGAAAISVLTEPMRFAGSLAHLEEVAAAVPDTPVMRKDFLVDPIQVCEARAAGASGVLLIAALLDDARLAEMLDCAFDEGMFVLLEAFDRNELQRCGELLADDAYAARAADDQLLIGVNTRNLHTLEVDQQRLAALAAELPAAACVAESGLRTADDAAAAAALGYRLALVGTALMRSPDPEQLVADMCHAGRGA